VICSLIPQPPGPPQHGPQRRKVLLTWVRPITNQEVPWWSVCFQEGVIEWDGFSKPPVMMLLKQLSRLSIGRTHSTIITSTVGDGSGLSLFTVGAVFITSAVESSTSISIWENTVDSFITWAQETVGGWV
jgi:hypothetical protein